MGGSSSKKKKAAGRNADSKASKPTRSDKSSAAGAPVAGSQNEIVSPSNNNASESHNSPDLKKPKPSVEGDAGADSTDADGKSSASNQSEAAKRGPENVLANDPRSLLVNIWSIIKSGCEFFQEAVLHEFGTPEYYDNVGNRLQQVNLDIDILRDIVWVKKWAEVLPSYQTGLVLVRSNQLVASVESLINNFNSVAEQNKIDSASRSLLKDSTKHFLGDLFSWYCGVELAVPQEVINRLNTTSTSLKVAMEAIEGSLTGESTLSDFDRTYRALSIDAMKLGKTACCRGLQQPNADLSRKMSDASYTVLRATKALNIMGRRIMADPGDMEARANATSISKGIMEKMKGIAELASVELSADPSWLVDTDKVTSFQKLLDTAASEVDDAVAEYSSTEGFDPLVVLSVQRISKIIEVCKKVMEQPDANATIKSAHMLVLSVEQICAQVMKRSPADDETLYSHLMNGMLACLHYTIHIAFGSVAKSIYHPIVYPEIAILNGMRQLLCTMSVLLAAATNSLKRAGAPPTEAATEEQLSDAEVAASIVDILHFGRPVVKDVEEILAENEQAKLDQERADVLAELEDIVGIVPSPRKQPTPELELEPTPAPLPQKQPEPVAAPAAKSPRSPKSPRKQKPNSPRAAKSPEAPRPVKEPKKPEEKKPVAAVAPVPAPTPTPTPAPTPAPTAAGGVNPDGSIPCPVADLPPLPAGFDINTISETNLPPGFPPNPGKPAPFEKGGSEDAYKAFMIQRAVHEAWENKIILYKIRMTAVLKAMGKM